MYDNILINQANKLAFQVMPHKLMNYYCQSVYMQIKTKNLQGKIRVCVSEVVLFLYFDIIRLAFSVFVFC